MELAKEFNGLVVDYESGRSNESERMFTMRVEVPRSQDIVEGLALDCLSNENLRRSLALLRSQKVITSVHLVEEALFENEVVSRVPITTPRACKFESYHQISV
jgi:hypothetical protein